MIKNLRREIDNLRMNALANQSPQLSADKIISSGCGNTMADSIDRSVDIEYEVVAMLNKYRKIRSRIVHEINSLPDPKHVELLYLKYVDGRCLEDVACIMRKPDGGMYNYNYVKKMHVSALESFLKEYPKVAEMSP